MTLEARLLDPLQDHFGLIELFEIVFGHTVTPAMWYWKYVPKWTDRHYCYVGRVDGKVIGYFGAVPLRGILDGEEVPFFQLSDFMVHPDYRLKYDYFGLGSQRILGDIKEKHEKHLVYGFSDHRAFRYFVRKKLGGLIEMANTRYLRLADAPRTTQFEFADWKWDAPEIDQLWEKFRKTIKAGLVRDVDYLTWRYACHPANTYRLLGVRRGGADVGFVVIGNDRPGERDRADEIPVVDALLPEDIAKDVLHELALHLDNDVMVWLPNRMAPDMSEKVESGTHCYHFIKDSAANTQELRDKLYYTMGDVDWW